MKYKYIAVCQDEYCQFAEMVEHKRLYCKRCTSEKIINESVEDDDKIDESPFYDAT